MNTFTFSIFAMLFAPLLALVGCGAPPVDTEPAEPLEIGQTAEALSQPQSYERGYGILANAYDSTYQGGVPCVLPDGDDTEWGNDTCYTAYSKYLPIVWIGPDYIFNHDGWTFSAELAAMDACDYLADDLEPYWHLQCGQTGPIQGTINACTAAGCAHDLLAATMPTSFGNTWVSPSGHPGRYTKNQSSWINIAALEQSWDSKGYDIWHRWYSYKNIVMHELLHQLDLGHYNHNYNLMYANESYSDSFQLQNLYADQMYALQIYEPGF